MYVAEAKRLTAAGARKVMDTAVAKAREGRHRRHHRHCRCGRAPGAPRAQAIALLETAIRRTVESAEFTKSSENLGVRPAFMQAGEFSELISKEDAALSRLMQLIGLKK